MAMDPRRDTPDSDTAEQAFSEDAAELQSEDDGASEEQSTIDETSWERLEELLKSGNGKALKRLAKNIRKSNDRDLVALLTRARQCERAEEQAGEQKARLARVQADFDNSLKRLERKALEDVRYAASRLMTDLLPAVDNLQRAIASAQAASDSEGLLRGVNMTLSGIESTLASHGLTPIDAAGQNFDPEVHEAVLTGANPDQPADIVLDCFERGWKLHDRVLRPAKVRVNKP